MYYVIKQQKNSPLQHFIGFIVNKYIASKNNEHVIFEFTKNGKVERKWVKKDEIILLTDDKKYFLEVFNQFKATEAQQQELVNEAKAQLEESMENFSTVMNEEIDKFNEIKHEKDVPCILKDM